MLPVLLIVPADRVVTEALFRDECAASWSGSLRVAVLRLRITPRAGRSSGSRRMIAAAIGQLHLRAVKRLRSSPGVVEVAAAVARQQEQPPSLACINTLIR